MDHHVPRAITVGLRRRGVDVVTAYEDGTSEVRDDELLAAATRSGRVLFSQDDDLLSVARAWLSANREFSGLIYAHQLSITVGRAVRELEVVAGVLECWSAGSRRHA